MRNLVLLTLMAVLLTGCGRPSATADAPAPVEPAPLEPASVEPAPASVEPAPAPVEPAEVNRLIASALDRPFTFTLEAEGEAILVMGVRPNGDCYVQPRMGNEFVHLGLQTWDLTWGPEEIHGPYWDRYLPQVPYTNELEAGCPRRLAGLAALEGLSGQMTRTFRDGTEIWSAVPDGAGGEELSLLPYQSPPGRLELEVTRHGGEPLPVAVHVVAAGEPEGGYTMTGRFQYGEPAFPSVPAVEGLGLAGVEIGMERDDVEWMVVEELSPLSAGPDGSVWVRAGTQRELRFDPAGRLTEVRRTGGTLLNGLVIGAADQREVERRFGPAAAASAQELVYRYPGGYELRFEMSGGRVAAVTAVGPGVQADSAGGQE